MKNLKKLISVIIAVIMLVGSFATVSAADYADVESTNSYYKAIKVLSGLGIAQGDDEGNFNPTNDVKRSEMVAFVCRMMGEEDIATASSSNAFSDVAANHWAAGYIAWGVNRGIINGMGDGTFAPDASVTYQDAVVMIMRALGYDGIAQRAINGGYPTGYLKLASQNKVLKDAVYDNAKAATREIIAQLIYNALSAPVVAVTDYSDADGDKYAILDGTNGKAYQSLLTDVNEIYKVKAEIAKTPKVDPSCIDNNGNYMVILNNVEAYEKYYETTVAANFEDESIYVGETEAADLLGVTVEAYIVEDEDLGWTLLAVVADAKSLKTETVKSTEVDFKDLTAGVFTYEDADGYEEEIELADTYTIYYNGKECTTTFTNEAAKEALLLAAEEITFSGSRTGKYNKVFVTDYYYAQVEEVFAEELYIITDDGSVELDPEVRNNKKFTYGLYNAEGEEITLADIAEDDILNIVAPLTVAADGSVNPAADLATVGYMDIYVTNKVVTGAVDEDFMDGVRYGIDGTTYKVVSDSLNTGDAGDFFLTIDGRVYAYDATSMIAKDFGFLVAAYSEGKYGNTVYENVIHIFTAEGSVEEFEVADRLVVDGVSKTEAQLSGDAGYIMTAIATKVVEGAKSDVQDAVFGRFLTYKLNSEGKLKEITFVGAADDYKYNGNLDRFASKKIEDAKLFIAPVSVKLAACADGCTETHEHVTEAVYYVDDEDLKMGSFDAMKHDETYTASVVSLDGKVLSAALLNDTIAAEFAGSHLAVVKSVNAVYDEEYETLTNYTLVQSGETISLKVDPDCEFGLSIGDVILYTVDANKMIDNVQVVWDMSEETFNNQGYTVDSDEFALVKGVVTDIEDGVMILDNNEATMYELLDGEGNTYVSIDTTDGSLDAKDIAVLRSKSNIRESNLRNVYTVISILTEEGYEDCVMIIADAE